MRECYLWKSVEFNMQMMSPLNNMYDPDCDLYYCLDESCIKKMGPTAYQRLLVIGHTKGDNLEALKWMADKLNYSFDVIDDDGNDLLMIAAEYGYLDIVTWLLEQGADMSRVNTENKSAYMIAVKNKHHEVADLIQKSQHGTHHLRFTSAVSFWKETTNNATALPKIRTILQDITPADRKNISAHISFWKEKDKARKSMMEIQTSKLKV